MSRPKMTQADKETMAANSVAARLALDEVLAEMKRIESTEIVNGLRWLKLRDFIVMAKAKHGERLKRARK